MLAGLVAALAAVGVAAALGAFSPDSRTAPTRPARPVQPRLAAADPTLGTVRCSATACAQGAQRVEPPIEGSPCTYQGRGGEWARIDADGQEPLFACVPSESPPDGVAPTIGVPDLAGARLDQAEGYLDRLGVGHDTSGGGTFGIIDRGNWTVCATKPEAGATLAPDDAVKLFVDRSC